MFQKCIEYRPSTTVGGGSSSGENGGGGGSNRGPVSPPQKSEKNISFKLWAGKLESFKIAGVPQMRRPREQRLGVRRAVQVRQVRQVLALLRHTGMWDHSQCFFEKARNRNIFLFRESSKYQWSS